ncbi:hypothetical protein NADFUDRAFT_64224 [Nadsonia fulvescens var. elongata DSM 6958]|uniref:C3H1-type domain-containing protein n=1 Tax=Nadsonia fulvescens var. elongata DSM 6958 TaxID=857566 RepID=A0A1E3PNP7_9ASCO|nr:hypothetical protein NADFUDRAFT_64224 [Nadsonia fulvescens var. elongata DSM 6958]
MAGKRGLCKFWAKGICKNGNTCAFEHVGAGNSPSPAPSSAKNSYKSPEQELDQWSKDIYTLVKMERPEYPFSSFSLESQGNLISGMDLSPNELRLMAYKARDNNTFPQYENDVKARMARMNQYVDFVLRDTRKAARYLQMAQKSQTGTIRPYAPPGFETSLVCASGASNNNGVGGGMFGSFNNTNNNAASSTGTSTGIANPFGSTSSIGGNSAFGSSAFGSTATAPIANPFGSSVAVGGSSVFGNNSPATSAFSGGFGGASSDSTVGASSSPFGSLSQRPVAGATSTPAFGSSSFGSSAFGSSGFGSVPGGTAVSQPFGTFGGASASTNNITNSSPFGSLNNPTASTGNTSGSSAFGSAPANTSTTGVAFGSSGFGSSPAISTNAFGAFGGGSSGAAPSPFGTTTTQTSFGQSSFGSAPGGTSSGPFGSSAISANSNDNIQSSFGAFSNGDNANGTHASVNASATPFGSSFGNPQTPSPFGAMSNGTTPSLSQPSSSSSNSEYPLPLNPNFPPFIQGSNDEVQPQVADIQPKFAAAFGAIKFTIGHVPDIVPPLEFR